MFNDQSTISKPTSSGNISKIVRNSSNDINSHDAIMKAIQSSTSNNYATSTGAINTNNDRYSRAQSVIPAVRRAGGGISSNLDSISTFASSNNGLDNILDVFDIGSSSGSNAIRTQNSSAIIKKRTIQSTSHSSTNASNNQYEDIDASKGKNLKYPMIENGIESRFTVFTAIRYI